MDAISGSDFFSSASSDESDNMSAYSPDFFSEESEEYELVFNDIIPNFDDLDNIEESQFKKMDTTPIRKGIKVLSKLSPGCDPNQNQKNIILLATNEFQKIGKQLFCEEDLERKNERTSYLLSTVTRSIINSSNDPRPEAAHFKFFAQARIPIEAIAANFQHIIHGDEAGGVHVFPGEDKLSKMAVNAQTGIIWGQLIDQKEKFSTFFPQNIISCREDLSNIFVSLKVVASIKNQVLWNRFTSDHSPNMRFVGYIRNNSYLASFFPVLYLKWEKDQVYQITETFNINSDKVMDVIDVIKYYENATIFDIDDETYAIDIAPLLFNHYDDFIVKYGIFFEVKHSQSPIITNSYSSGSDEDNIFD
ncbi:MAG: hypothetical protein WDZ28_05615 [Simkaniaceae bacterium]